jgi:hypothetical protein
MKRKKKEKKKKKKLSAIVPCQIEYQLHFLYDIGYTIIPQMRRVRARYSVLATAPTAPSNYYI